MDSFDHKVTPRSRITKLNVVAAPFTAISFYDLALLLHTFGLVNLMEQDVVWFTRTWTGREIHNVVCFLFISVLIAIFFVSICWLRLSIF